jgi:hypothetical protein
VEVNPPTPEGKIQVPLPRLDIVGKADVEVIGKDDKSVADLQLNYVVAAEAPPEVAVKASGRGWHVLFYVLLIGLLPALATLYDIKKSYDERAKVLDRTSQGQRTTEEIGALLTSMDEGPTGLLGLTRGIIALTLVLVLAIVDIHLVVYAPVNVPDIADKLIMLLAGTLTAITGFYFGSKAASDAAQKAERSAPPASSAEKPTILKVEPPSSKAGASVKLCGRGFGSKEGKVTFGNVQATLDANGWKHSEIAVQVPDKLTLGPVHIVVTTADGASASTDNFTAQ